MKYVDMNGETARRRNPDTTWPWRRADGRTWAEVDPIGKIARERWGRVA